jgi:hypothetical protein
MSETQATETANRIARDAAVILEAVPHHDPTFPDRTYWRIERDGSRVVFGADGEDGQEPLNGWTWAGYEMDDDGTWANVSVDGAPLSNGWTAEDLAAAVALA